jgi:hypothetical protein
MKEMKEEMNEKIESVQKDVASVMVEMQSIKK